MSDLRLMGPSPTIEGPSPYPGSRRQARLSGSGGHVYLSTVPNRPDVLQAETYGTLGQSRNVRDVRVPIARFVPPEADLAAKQLYLDRLSTSLIEAVPDRFKPWKDRLGSARGSSLILAFQYPLVAELLTAEPEAVVPEIDQLSAVALSFDNAAQLASSLTETDQRIPRPTVRLLRDTIVRGGIVDTSTLGWLSTLAAGLARDELPELLHAVLATAGNPPDLRTVMQVRAHLLAQPPHRRLNLATNALTRGVNWLLELSPAASDPLKLHGLSSGELATEWIPRDDVTGLRRLSKEMANCIEQMADGRHWHDGVGILVIREAGRAIAALEVTSNRRVRQFEGRANTAPPTKATEFVHTMYEADLLQPDLPRSDPIGWEGDWTPFDLVDCPHGPDDAMICNICLDV